jgi:hypothetical protein
VHLLVLLSYIFE